MAKKKSKLQGRRPTNATQRAPARHPSNGPRNRGPVRQGQYSARGFGSALGGWLGNAAGSMASTLLGMGDYEVRGNSLMAKGVPMVHSSNTSVRMTHREFIQDISSSTAFTVSSFPVNPGDPTVFPYLAGIAQNFERYQIHGMVFYFRSTSADALNSTNTALGTVIIASEYDVLDSDFTDKQSMEAAMFSISGKPSEDLVHPIECDPSNRFNKQLFLRLGSAANPSGSDARLYDWCTTSVATTGSQAASVIGELWVSYDIELFVPQTSVPRNMIGKYFHSCSTNNYTDAAPLGTTRTVYNDSIGVTQSNTVVTIQANNYGNYLIVFRWAGISAAVTSPTYTLSNCAAYLTWAGHASTDLVPATITTSYWVQPVVIYIVDPLQVATITLSAATLPTAGAFFDLLIVQVNGALTTSLV